MASAGYDILFCQNVDASYFLPPGDQLSSRTDYGGVPASPLTINGVGFSAQTLANYAKLMVLSQGTIAASGRGISTNGNPYAGHGGVQGGAAYDSTLNGGTNMPSWVITAGPSGSLVTFNSTSTLTTTYGVIDLMSTPPQAGSQWYNDAGISVNVDLFTNVTGGFTGYWAAALLV